MVRRGSPLGFRAPRRSASRRARDEPAGRPRWPLSQRQADPVPRFLRQPRTPGRIPRRASAPWRRGGRRPRPGSDRRSAGGSSGSRGRRGARPATGRGSSRPAGRAAPGRGPSPPRPRSRPARRRPAPIGPWPAPGLGVVGVGPGEDLLEGQPRQGMDIAHGARLGQQARQARPARQAPPALEQGKVDRFPGLALDPAHAARSPRRPPAGGRVVGVGPGEDAFGGQRPPQLPMLGQQLGQRRAARQAAQALVQGRLDGDPGLADRQALRLRVGLAASGR